MDLLLTSQDPFTEALFRQCRSFFEQTELYRDADDPLMFENESWLPVVRYTVKKMQRNCGSHSRRAIASGSVDGWGGHAKGGRPFVEPPLSEFEVDLSLVEANNKLGLLFAASCFALLHIFLCCRRGCPSGIFGFPASQPGQSEDRRQGSEPAEEVEEVVHPVHAQRRRLASWR